jgi:probable rRNA maturation factor
VNKEKISNLHQQFFDDPSPTDCISFPIDTTKARKKEFSVLGEIFVCPKVAIEYATAHTIDPYLELSLYTVHGLLHLLGYDDLDPKQRKEMRREEKRCLKLLTEQNRLIKSRDKSC